MTTVNLEDVWPSKPPVDLFGTGAFSVGRTMAKKALKRNRRNRLRALAHSSTSVNKRMLKKLIKEGIVKVDPHPKTYSVDDYKKFVEKLQQTSTRRFKDDPGIYESGLIMMPID